VRSSDKKEYLMVLVLLFIIVVAGLIMSSRHTQLEYKYPKQQTVLNNSDYTVNTGHGLLEVGKASFAEVTDLYPKGRTLGMSTVYSSKNGCYFTFSKKENILIIAHISTNQASTFRHITVNDPFTLLVKAYGKNYARVNQKGNAADFDAVYGQGNTIIFQVRHNLVKKIIIQREVK
jgi:hypothetical protein